MYHFWTSCSTCIEFITMLTDSQEHFCLFLCQLGLFSPQEVRDRAGPRLYPDLAALLHARTLDQLAEGLRTMEAVFNREIRVRAEDLLADSSKLDLAKYD
jgi:hypothetical protein